MVASANVFRGADGPPRKGINIYHFRIKDLTVLTASALVSRSPSSLALRPRYSVSGFRRAASDVWLPFLSFSKTPARATRLTLVLSKNTFILKDKSLRALLDPLNDQTFFL